MHPQAELYVYVTGVDVLTAKHAKTWSMLSMLDDALYNLTHAYTATEKEQGPKLCFKMTWQMLLCGASYAQYM